MPLVLLSGLPSSGKTKRANELKTHLENKLNREVFIISDRDVMQRLGVEKNDLFHDARKEKQFRSIIKSDIERNLVKDNVLIIDAGNYIKGYRYELYCLSKSLKTTQCTILCEISSDSAWKNNESRPDSDKYTKETFDALILRFEEPDSRCRWDNPLFIVHTQESLPFDDIYNALFLRQPPPPNQSTQSTPITPTDFVYNFDKTTHDIVTVLLEAKRMNLEGEIKVPGYESCVRISDSSQLTPGSLSRLRRQFLSYVKLNPVKDSAVVGPLFIQFLNSNLL